MSTRREFISTGATAALATTLACSSRAIEPIKRSAKSEIKLSLAAYSYRDYLLGKRQPNMNLSDFINRAATYPVDGVELTEYYWPKPYDHNFMMSIKKQCYLHGLAITGSPMGNVFTHPAGPARDKELQRVREWVDRCALFGAPSIRIFAGGVQKGQTLAEAKSCAIETIQIACEYAATKGVILALENHGGIVAEPDDMLDIIKGVRSDWFGVNLDTGNFHTDDPYRDLAKIAPYAVVVQIKVEVQAKGKAKEPADYARKIKILRDAGFRGYAALEYEADEEPLNAVPRHLEAIRKLI